MSPESFLARTESDSGQVLKFDFNKLNIGQKPFKNGNQKLSGERQGCDNWIIIWLPTLE